MDLNLLAFEEDITRLCGVDTSNTFDERALTRTIIANKGGDLSGICIEVHMLQNVDGAE